MMRVSVAAVAVFATAAAVGAAGIQPADQQLAQRLTLRLSDFPAGWTTKSAPSTRPGKIRCAKAPKLDAALTGFSDSAGLVPVHFELDKRSADSSTRVFSSPAAARAFSSWAGGGESACFLARAVASWKRNPDFEVSRPRHARESFALDCSSCPAHSLSAWRWGFTIAKEGQRDTTYVFDWVVVRVGRAVISFSFYSVDSPFGPDARRLVATVLRRG
jgi:hypothetical protein